MAAESRRQLSLLIGLLVLLALVGWWQFGGGGPAGVPGGPATARRVPAPGRRGAGEAPDQVLARGVGLGRLDEHRPAPEEASRDPFRSGSPASSGGTGSAGGANPAPVVPATPVVPAVPQPPQPPPLPAIAVKFIGVVSRRDVGKVAVLSDGKNVYYGREGEIVDGRWRIVSIGEESLQIEYADGRGRQTVRMTG